jgi:hypothetical protein
MKLVLVHDDNYSTFLSQFDDDHFVFVFDDHGIWLPAISFTENQENEMLSVFNEQLKLNGTITTQCGQPFLLLNEEELFRLKITILTYQEFDF